MVSPEGYGHVDSMRHPSHVASEPLGAKLRYPHHCLLMVAKGVALRWKKFREKGYGLKKNKNKEPPLKWEWKAKGWRNETEFKILSFSPNCSASWQSGLVVSCNFVYKTTSIHFPIHFGLNSDRVPFDCRIYASRQINS